MSAIKMPTIRRMRILADAGLSYRAIAEAVSLYEGQPVTFEQVRYHVRRTGFRGAQYGPGIQALRRGR